MLFCWWREKGGHKEAKDFLKSSLIFFVPMTKGQLISKANCQAEDSPKKRRNEFVFTTVRLVFVRFLGESMA